MIKKVLLIILMTIPVLLYAKRVNWIVANIGSYSITKYDIEQMQQFGKDSGNPKYTKKMAISDLILSYSLLMYERQDENINIRESDMKKILSATTNVSAITNKEERTVAEYRRNLYMKYPEEFMMQMKKQQIMRSLAFYDETIKDKAQREIVEDDRKDFYKENKAKFMKRPKADFIVFAAHQPRNLDLTQLEKFEEYWPAIAKSLKRSNNTNRIFKKYRRKIRFLSYSGRSGKTGAYELMKKYPAEVVNICFMDKIPMPPKPIYVRPGRVISFPQPIPMGARKKPTYIVIKLISREKPVQMTYEEAKGFMDNHIKEDFMNDAIKDFIVNQLTKRDIILNILDKKDTTFKGVYDEFIGR